METFVLRVWMPVGLDGAASDGGSQPLQGVVEHIASGKSFPFKGSEQLLHLVCQGLDESRRRRTAGSEPVQRA